MNLKLSVAAILLCACVALAVGQTQIPPDKAFFPIPGTGFGFLRPKAWKTGHTRYEERLYLPTAKSHGTAVAHFIAIDFRDTIANWQAAQVDVAKQRKATIERQWQEEVLGVPLLLTKMTYDADGAGHVVLSGLLFTATPNKMFFRIECLADDFDEVDADWRTAFETLRTTDGSTPQPDDPNRPLTKTEVEEKPVVPPPVTQIGAEGRKPKIVEGSIKVPGKAGGMNALIRLPKGWEALVQKDGSWLLHGSDPKVVLRMTLASTLDSDPPRQALFKSATASLNSFKLAPDRTEFDDKSNRAGAVYSTIWRSGIANAGGSLTSCDSIVISGQFYVIVSGIFSGGLPTSAKKAVDEMLSETTIDTAS